MSTFTQTIIEDLEINGEKINRVLKIQRDFTDIFRRTVTVPSGVDTTVATFKSTVGVADGAIDIDLVRYVRITNLNTTGSCNISLQIDSGEDDSGADEQFTMKLPWGRSFFIYDVHDALCVHDTSASIDVTFHDLESIIVDSSADTKIDVFIGCSAS